MKHKTTEIVNFAVAGKAEVAGNTRITGLFELKYKKSAVTTSLGLVAGVALSVASLP